MDVDTGEPSYYHYDGQGNTRAVTDKDENVTDTFNFDSWGNLLSRTGMTNVPFQFGGEHGYYKDEELDTYYVMARVYDPSIIRWLSIDPLEFGDGMNLYLYVLNRPADTIDRTGLAGENATDGKTVERDSNRHPATPQYIQAFDRNAVFNQRGSRAAPPGNARIGDCKFLVCSNPVNSGAIGITIPVDWQPPQILPRPGHLFILCDGQAYRGGPGWLSGPGSPKIAPGCKWGYCPPWGQLWGMSEPFDRNNIDWPKSIAAMRAMDCIQVHVPNKRCEEVCGCFQTTLDDINECCIKYEPVPEVVSGLPGERTANSNSTVMWLLKRCAQPRPPLLPVDYDKIQLPGGGRIHTGKNVPIPDCLPGRAQA